MSEANKRRGTILPPLLADDVPVLRDPLPGPARSRSSSSASWPHSGRTPSQN